MLPAVLALDPEIRAEDLSRKLEQVNGAAATSTLTLLDRNGRALAASNSRTPGSNVGNDYCFRPYFQQTMAHGSGDFYALGVTTAVPGYFLSEAVRDDDGSAIGVVVVKVMLMLPVLAGEVIAACGGRVLGSPSLLLPGSLREPVPLP